MFLLGQLQSVPAEAIKDFALIVVGLVGAAVGIKTLFFRKPSIDAEFVSKHEFTDFMKEIREDVGELRDEMHLREQRFLSAVHSMKDEVLAAGSSRGRQIYETINAMSADLHNKINQVNDTVARLDERTKTL